MKPMLLVALVFSAAAAHAQAPALPAWILPKKPPNPAGTAQAHVLLGADAPRLVRVCYASGPEGSFIVARSSAKGGAAQVTHIHKGACADVGGTDVELTNPNEVAVSGTYEQPK